ncbi:unnamed protein product [Zymoseptoria tritici ST99CH_3D1]|nr:unnamed protein product [Zymoseptoria tritici ST99CH_3D1]
MANLVNSSNGNSIVHLHNQLDTLWARYLDLLDEYTSAQEAIKQHLSSGFISLAKANFHSSGRRYGQDSYDQRAVATTRVAFKTEGERLKISVTKLESHPKSDQAETSPEPSKETPTSSPEPSKPNSELNEPPRNHLPSPSPTPEPDSTPNPPTNTAEKLSEEPPPKPTTESRDPIRQFGILIPPALRSAQASFSKAVLAPEALARAVQAAREMRGVEMEMRRARKGLRKAEKAGEGR